MMGDELARHIAGRFLLGICVAAIVGAVLALGGYFLIGWLVDNISISWG